MTGRHCQNLCSSPTLTRFDPAIAADPYPHYRELSAGERVQYNPKRDVCFEPIRRRPQAARNHDVVQRRCLLTGWLPFLPTSDPPAHPDAQTTGTRYGAWRVGAVAPDGRPACANYGRRVTDPDARRTSSPPCGRTDADARYHRCSGVDGRAALPVCPARRYGSPTLPCQPPG